MRGVSDLISQVSEFFVRVYRDDTILYRLNKRSNEDADGKLGEKRFLFCTKEKEFLSLCLLLHLYAFFWRFFFFQVQDPFFIVTGKIRKGGKS